MHHPCGGAQTTKLIRAPAGDHRATGMVERLIKTMKRKLGVMTIDPLWSSEDVPTIAANIIQSIRPDPNRVTNFTISRTLW